LARERDSDRTLELERRHDRKKDLILRSQAGSKGTADKPRKNTHFVVAQTENSAAYPWMFGAPWVLS